MEFIIKSYENVLTQLDASQLMQLRDKLNKLTFISIDQLILGVK